MVGPQPAAQCRGFRGHGGFLLELQGLTPGGPGFLDWGENKVKRVMLACDGGRTLGVMGAGVGRDRAQTKGWVSVQCSQELAC